MTLSRWGFIMGLLLTTASAAGSRITVNEYHLTRVDIAEHLLNQLHIEGERIERVVGLQAHYSLKTQPSGDVFIKPTAHARPFTLYVTTDKAHTYPLLIVPATDATASITLVPLHRATESVSLPPLTASPYTRTLITFIHAMARGAPVSDMTRIPVTGHAHRLPHQSLRYRITTVYRGDTLQGEVAEVTNTSDNSQSLHVTDFYQAGTLALSLSTTEVAPHQTTTLYRVRHA